MSDKCPSCGGPLPCTDCFVMFPPAVVPVVEDDRPDMSQEEEQDFEAADAAGELLESETDETDKEVEVV